MKTNTRVFAQAVVLASLFGIGGCSTIDGLTGRSSASQPVASSGSSGNSWTKAFIFGSAEPPPIVKPEDTRTINCPEITVLDGTSAYRIARADAGSEGVSYQASLVQFARECIVEGNTLKMRVGIEGRVLLGPSGKPGTYAIPVRVAAKKDDAAAYSKGTRVNVTVPADAMQATFTYVDDGLVFPIDNADPAEQYQIFVGFDPDVGAPKPERKRRRR